MAEIISIRKRICRLAIKLFICFALICTGSRTLPADDSLCTADDMFAFALHLYEQNEYDAAIGGFRRFMFHYSSDPRIPEAMFKTGMSHFRKGRHGEAVDTFDRVIGEYGKTDLATESAFMAARCDQRRNNYHAALSRLNALADPEQDPAVRDRALYAIGWLMLETRNPGAAGNAFQAISDAGEARYKPADLVERLSGIDTLPVKRPAVAGILSVIPGGGYLYTKRRSDALISFVFVSAGAGAAWESFDNDMNILGAILAFVTAGFYSGSIYGSIGSAHKYNADVYDAFVSDLRENRPDPAEGFSPPGFREGRTNKGGIVLRFPF